MSILDSNKIHRAEKSPTLRMSEISRIAESEGKTIYKFGFGQSPFSPPKQIVDALIKNASLSHYTSVQGENVLRENITKFHSSVSGLDYLKPENLIIGAGSKILIYSVLAALKNATVIIPAPAWVSYEPQSLLIGHSVARIVTDYESRWRVTPDILEEVCKSEREKSGSTNPLVMILNYPGNPDGLGYSDDELKAIADICRKYSVLVIADEIYGMLNHNGKYPTIARYYPEGTIISTGLSKWCGAGGWRFGAMFFPDSEKALLTATIGVASETYSCAATPVQYAAIEAYRDYNSVKPYIDAQNKILGTLGSYIAKKLRDAGVKVHNPEGGFYLFVDFSNHAKAIEARRIKNCYEFTERLLAEKGVALLASADFGMPENLYGGRLAYVDFDGNKAIQLYHELKDNFNEQDILKNPIFAKQIKGIDEIISFL